MNNKHELFEAIKDHVNSIYPFLLENKGILYGCKHELVDCIDEYLLENNIIMQKDKINLIASDILNSIERMKYVIGASSKLHDLIGNEIKGTTSFDRYFATVRLRELELHTKKRSIDAKIGILIKKIKEINQWKDEFIKLDNQIKERMERCRINEEKIRAKRKELEYEISQFKMERNRSMQNTSKNVKIGKYMKDLIIKEYLDKQALQNKGVEQ
jgi:hypothetical protein